MAIFKKGENLQFSIEDIRPVAAVMEDEEIHNRFKKIAAEIKKIAPKAEDFLYFTAIMMHAAERSILNDDGTIKKDANGKDIKASWDVDEKGSWKWKCSDSSINPYKNNNGDIFPESELKLAYRKWIGKPLCKDHQSSSVDGIRGIILDTYWDPTHKRIISLCALDKVNYPDLARKVESGYANNVSMGTAVGRSICTTCGNVATTEAEYCQHVKGRTAYGEVNVDLSPIELSLVVNGADTKAKVLEVLAAAQKLQEKFSKTGSLNISEVRSELNKLSARVDELEHENLLVKNDNNLSLKRTANLERYEEESYLKLIKHKLSDLEQTFNSIANTLSTEDLMSGTTKKAYWLGTEEPTPGKPQYAKEEADKIRNTEDRQMVGLTNLGPVDGLPSEDLSLKQKLSRATLEERRQIRAAVVEKAQQSLKSKAYIQGTEEPGKPGTPKYLVDPGWQARNQDKNLDMGNALNTNVTNPDEALKKTLLRAALKARLVKDATYAGANKWDIVDKGTNTRV